MRKILLESRSLPKDDMFSILDKLVDRCASNQDRRGLPELIANEKHLYIEPRHGRHILNMLWDIGQAVRDRLPTAKIVDKIENVYIMEAEVFGKGIEMWLRSQGSHVERIP